MRPTLHHLHLLFLMLMLCLTGICGPVCLAAPNGPYAFAHLTSQDGLPSSNVRCVLADSYGFVWLGTKNGLCRYDGQRLQTFICHDPQTDVGNNNVVSLAEDLEGNLWVGTDACVFRLDRGTETFTHVMAGETSEQPGWVKHLQRDAEGRIWAVHPGYGLVCYDPTTEPWTGRRYPLGAGEEAIPYSLLEGEDHTLWVGTRGKGLFCHDAKSDEWRPWVDAEGHTLLPGQIVTNLAQYDQATLALATENGQLALADLRLRTVRMIDYPHDADIFVNAITCREGRIWLASVQGLYVIDPATGECQKLMHDPVSDVSLSDNDISCLYLDPNDGLWAGTNFGGVNIHSPRLHPFSIFVHTSDPNSLANNRIRGIAETCDGSIWVGTEGNGLNRIDGRTGEMKRIDAGLSSQHVLRLYSHDDALYLGLFHNGFDRMTLRLDGTMSTLRHDLPREEEWNRSVYCTMLDSRGTEWVGMDKSLMYRRQGATSFEELEPLQGSWIFDLLEASDGSIWIASMGAGLYHYNTVTGIISRYTVEDGRSGLRSNAVSALMQDRQGRIWASTDRGGLCLYHPDSDSFETYGLRRGLPDNVCYDVLEDRQGRLWFGTNQGLVCFCPDDTIGQNQLGPLLRTIVFDTTNGLPTRQFNYHSACEAHDGTFWFGTTEGLLSFRPELTESTGRAAQIYFTHFMAAGRALPFLTDHITLPYDSAFLMLQMSAPDFGDAASPQFSYQLLPTSDDWQTVPADGELNLAGLSPGRYTLRVKADRLGQETLREVTIRVLPPWWRSWWAYILYVLAAAGLLAGSLLYMRRRTRQRLAEHKKLYALHMEKQLNENKVQFFTEIAHEIRTPLTLIDSPLEAMEDYVDSERFLLPEGQVDMKSLRENSRILRGYIDTMRRNTRRLLDLTSQLLDFQKIGQRRLKLQYENVEVHSLVEEVIGRFQQGFQLKGKTLSSHLGDADILASADREALTKIISNLLNNGLKYCQHEVDVHLSADDEKFTLVVESDSEPIASADRERIFEPFYQVDGDVKRAGGGVGIGLPLSRQLAQQHKGNLYVRVEEGNQFVLEIPLCRERIEQQNAEKVHSDRLVMAEEPETREERETGHALLLVEDNEEMRQFLSEQLTHHYTIFTAGNGQQALAVLREHPVDLVLTDVMMPEMDGFELCRRLKADEEQSNVPVVFLTAKNDTDSKVRGLQCGAEAYIEKPFSIKYLRQQLQSILDNRRRERVSFQKKPFFNVDNMKVSHQDEQFMQKVIQHIEHHMADEQFSVDNMADELCMSRSTLLRRIKALYGQSPVELVRTVRLKKAAELIQQGDNKLSEVGYLVGINSPSYFSKLFFKQFGIMPRDFAAQCHPTAKSALLD